MAPIQSRIAIVGAGISGLICAIYAAALGAKVTVFEKADSICRTGYGVQVPPNACKVLHNLGLLNRLLGRGGNLVDFAKSMHYNDGRVLLDRDLTDFERLYGGDWMVIHRYDLFVVLLTEAMRRGVVIRFGAEVAKVGFSASFVGLTCGEVIMADAVVGADGIWSVTRRNMLPDVPGPKPSGHVAYRYVFTREELSGLIFSGILDILWDDEDICRYWLGPKANVVLYALGHEKDMFNFELFVADDPIIRAMIEIAPHLAKEKLYVMEQLPYWHHGRVVLMGDAAHLTLPYLAQGSALGVEDGAILGTLLGLYSASVQDRNALGIDLTWIYIVYELLQKRRTTSVARRSALVGHLNHLSDSTPAQIKRDFDFMRSMLSPESYGCTNPWVDAPFNDWLLGNDADCVVLETILACLDEDAFEEIDEQNHDRPRDVMTEDLGWW